jgi:hypothetical protein
MHVAVPHRRHHGVTLHFKDKIECINLMCALGTVAHISRQITKSIIIVYLTSRLIHHLVLYNTSDK